MKSLLLFGETGSGKSTLGNYILEEEVFKVGDDLDSITKNTIGKKSKNNDKYVIDSPGLSDSNSEDIKHLNDMIDFIKKHKELQAIVVVLNFQISRITNSMRNILKLISNIFQGVDIGNNLCIVFTHTYHENEVEETRDDKGNKYSKEIKNILNSSAKKINCFFVDIFKETAKKKIKFETKVEIEALLKWVGGLEPLYTKYAINQGIEKFKKKEESRKHYSETNGDYIIEYDLVKTRYIITYFDKTVQITDWSKEIIENKKKKLNIELIKKREEAKREEKRKREIEERKRIEEEEQEREKEKYREKIRNIKNNEPRNSYHMPNALTEILTHASIGIGGRGMPVYERSFAEGRGNFSVNVNCYIF
jgi:ABC-type dipeptide/oligopeptide/nickel transport system ATPase subunit